MLGACFWGSWGSLGVPWTSLGVLWVSLGRSLGVLGGPGRVLGSSWGALGVILEVWGDPWISPGRSDCCDFVGFRWYSEMSCFLMIFHRNLEVMMFSRNEKHYMVFILHLGGRSVAISLVLGMCSEFHIFSQLRFL